MKEQIQRLSFGLISAGLSLSLTCATAAAEEPVAQPISEIIAVRPSSSSVDSDYVFLKVPVRFVDFCLGGLSNGIPKTFVRIHAKSNGASYGHQEVIIKPDGSYQSADGSPLITANPPVPVNVGFFKTYKCLVPVLTGDQRARLTGGSNKVHLLGILKARFQDIPGDPVKVSDTDLVQSRRYDGYRVGRFVFNQGNSGGISPYLPGTSIGEVVVNPGVYGVLALYHRLQGSCSTELFASDDQALNQLQAECAESELLRHANEASKGVGITILHRYRQ
jgi:hypothetical protein